MDKRSGNKNNKIEIIFLIIAFSSCYFYLRTDWGKSLPTYLALAQLVFTIAVFFFRKNLGYIHGIFYLLFGMAQVVPILYSYVFAIVNFRFYPFLFSAYYIETNQDAAIVVHSLIILFSIFAFLKSFRVKKLADAQKKIND